MNVIQWKQSDPRWGKQLLGYNTEQLYNLANYGCLISSLGSLAATVTQDPSWTPQKINNLFKANNGFDPGAGLLRWWKVPQLLPMLADHGFEPSNTVPKGWLNKESNWAILKVNNGAHYVLAINPTQIMDPATGTIRPINTYPIAAVRLYEAIGGKGAVQSATISTSTTEVDMFTNPNNGDSRDAKGWYNAYDERDQMWHKSEEKAGVLQRELEVANERVGALQEKIDELERQASLPVLEEAAAPDYERTERPYPQRLVAARPGVMPDFAGQKPDYVVNAGMIFHIASRFTHDGADYLRTERSESNGDWYGVSVDLFDDLPAEDTTVPAKGHVAVSMTYGLAQRIAAWASHLFKRNKGIE